MTLDDSTRRALAAGGIVGPAGFIAAWTLSGHATDGYSPVSDFISEITDTGRPAQGDFAQGALVQETINAFEQSFRSRAWVDFPLSDGGPAAAIGKAAR